MKKSFLLMASLMGALTLQAQTSPWTGNVLPEEGGTFYLYQVETGLWLQNNNRVAEYWTTRAEIDKIGFDVIIKKLPDGGYQLDPRFGHNHSINGHNYYLDTNDALTKWNIVPTEVDGVSNTYKIFTDDEHYLNANDEGFLDDFGWNENWQLISYEDRIEALKQASKENPMDATWLIGGHDFANQDERNQWDVVQEGDGVYAQGGDGIAHGNRAVECWKKTKFILSRTFTGLPNGTYEFKLQGFYRDGTETAVGEKRLSGNETIRASLFINDVSRPFKSILESGVYEQEMDSYAVPQGGVYIPGNSVPGNALDRASNCFFLGGYWNDPVKVVVSDGSLTIGMQKLGGGDDDWLVFDSFTLTYLGEEIDLGPVKENLQAALDDAAAYEGVAVAALTTALANAQAAMNGTDAAAIANATMALRNALTVATDYTNVINEATAFDGVMTSFFETALADAQAAAAVETDVEAMAATVQALRNALNDVRNAQDPMKFIEQTLPFAEAEGVDANIIDNAKNVLQTTESLSDINDALNQLRMERRILAADKHADVFKGATPVDGDFYIYNVGLKRFLCGGGDWGAHAFVGFPGVEVTLISGTEYPDGGDAFSGYKIETHLSNGDNSDYLNYGGYMDTPHQNLWEFVAVEGKEGVYAIARANGESNDQGERMLLGYRPGTYGNIDTDMYGIDNVNNQWKLVTRAERDELLATATATAPQDATYKIMSPNFNQREDVSAWNSAYDNGTFVGRGDNKPDFVYELWNDASFDFSQNIYELEPGWYTVTVQGYYRDGDHENQIRVEAAGGERVRAAELVDFNTEERVALPNILDEKDKAPGLGNRDKTRYLIEERDEFGEIIPNEDGTPHMIEDPNGEWLYVGEFPKWCDEAIQYFQLGLYKTKLLMESTDGSLMILLTKERESARDWIVFDNFRLTYYGTVKPTEEELGVKDIVETINATGKVYNLQGQQVKTMQKGLFISDGKKFFKK